MTDNTIWVRADIEDDPDAIVIDDGDQDTHNVVKSYETLSQPG